MDVAAVYDQIALSPLSLSGLALLLLVALPACSVAGYFNGRSRREKLLEAKQPLDKVVVETTLGSVLALLGLLLAFSFGNALSLAQERKAAAVDEAAALGTAFLRTDFLPEPGRTELRAALVDYAKTRIVPGDGSLRTLADTQGFVRTSLEAQSRLWPLTMEATVDPLPAPLKTFVAGAVNDVIDAHLYRAKTLSNPVSDVTQLMILGLAMTSLFLQGDRTGHLGRDLTWHTFVFSGFLFIVMMSISDTMRPVEGLVQTDVTTLKATILEMELALQDVR